MREEKKSIVLVETIEFSVSPGGKKTAAGGRVG